MAHRCKKRKDSPVSTESKTVQRVCVAGKRTLAPKLEARQNVGNPPDYVSAAQRLIEPFGYVVEKGIMRSLLGAILLCQHPIHGRAVCKVLDNSLSRCHVSTFGALTYDTVQRETQVFDALSSNPHKNMVKLLHIVSSTDVTCLVLESATHGDLLQVAQTQAKLLTIERARYIFSQCARAVQHLHNLGFAHLDISMENLLLTDHDRVMLCDFGSCTSIKVEKFTSNSKQPLPGKVPYQAPELLYRDDYDYSVDTYALGIVLYALLFRTFPFRGAKDARFSAMVRGEYLLAFKGCHGKPAATPDALDLLSKMITVREKRWSLHKVLRHPWMKHA